MAPRKHLDVMVSSTALDLPEHRLKTMNAILMCGMFPIVMEHLPPLPGDAIDSSLKMVDEADIYIGIFGLRYGFVPEDPIRNPDRLSITELEYRQAMKRGIPILSFIMSDEHPLPSRAIDLDNFLEKDPIKKEKLEQLKANLRTKHTVKHFDSAEALPAFVMHGLIPHMAQPDTPSTQSASPVGIIPAPSLYSIPPYNLTVEFFGREAELQHLDEWAQSSDTMMVIEAIGGMGKSALTWEWTNKRAPEVLNPAGRFWYSFYDTGANIETFVRHALAYITGQDLIKIKPKTYQECALNLLAELQKRPYLLVLDGLERILLAYHRLTSAQLRDEEVPSDPDVRACIDGADGEFLRQLLNCTPSKILISTRLMPRDLETHGWLMRSIRRIVLNSLSSEDAEKLLRSRGVKKANKKNLHDFLNQFGFHALVVTILAGDVAKLHAAPGDFDKWLERNGSEFRKGILSADTKDIKKNRTRILQFAYDGLAQEKQRLLSQIAMYSDPVTYDNIAIFNPYLPPRPPEPILPTIPYVVENPFKPSPFNFGAFALGKFSEEDAGKDELDDSNATINESKSQSNSRQIDPEKRQQIFQRQGEIIARRAKILAEFEHEYQMSPEYCHSERLFEKALSELEDRGLLAWDRDNNIYDMHPLVRAFAYDQLQAEDREISLQSIGDHLSIFPKKDWKEVEQLADLRYEIEIYRSFLKRDEYDMAVSFFLTYMWDALFVNLTACHWIIRLMEPLFDEGYTKLIRPISQANQCTVLQVMLGVMVLIGEYDKAERLIHGKIALALEIRNDKELFIALRYDIRRYLDNGMLSEAHQAIELTYLLAKKADNTDELEWANLLHLRYLRIVGKWEEAEILYRQIKESANEWVVANAHFEYLNILFYRQEPTESILALALESAISTRTGLLLQRIASLQSQIALRYGDLFNAQQFAHEALKRAQLSSLSPGHELAVLAYLEWLQGKRETAGAFLEQALEKSCPTEYQINVFLIAAKIKMHNGDHIDAQKCALRAYELAKAEGQSNIYRYGLEQSKEVLNELNVVAPDIKDSETDKVSLLPYEAKIREFVEAFDNPQKPGDAVENTDGDYVFNGIDWFHVGNIASFGFTQNYVLPFSLTLKDISYEPLNYILYLPEEDIELQKKGLPSKKERPTERVRYGKAGSHRRVSELPASFLRNAELADKVLLFVYIESAGKYVYTALLVSKIEQFFKEVDSGKPVDIAKYGKIYAAGDFPPPEDVRKYMEDQYVFGHKQCHICIVP